MLAGRLGLESAKIPHADRQGLVWLSRGCLSVHDGTLHFVRELDQSNANDLEIGDYEIPFQAISMILLGPGSKVSHDALRILARHGTALVAVGEDGVRSYTAPPLIRDDSKLARLQAEAWCDKKNKRLIVARKMYAWRFGEVLPHRDLDVLRGIEGSRVKKSYANWATKYKIKWQGRRYDRANPNSADIPNQAINHVSTAVEAAAAIAVSATATIPQLGFLHEDPGQSFVLDIADLFRESVTIPTAFSTAAKIETDPSLDIERLSRRSAGNMLKKENVIPKMIEQIKSLFEI